MDNGKEHPINQQCLETIFFILGFYIFWLFSKAN